MSSRAKRLIDWALPNSLAQIENISVQITDAQYGSLLLAPTFFTVPLALDAGLLPYRAEGRLMSDGTDPVDSPSGN